MKQRHRRKRISALAGTDVFLWRTFFEERGLWLACMVPGWRSFKDGGRWGK